MKPALELAARTILKPFIKLMLKNGVDVGEFSSLAKIVYVEVAQDPDFALRKESGAPKRITTSRIALLTGINRKEVKRLQDEGLRRPDHSHTNRAVRVISGWTNDKRFCNRQGRPRVLPYSSLEDDISFDTLVRDYSGDMTSRVILDELVTVGAAKLDNDGNVTLVNRTYVPSVSDEEMLRIGSNAVRDLTETVASNLERTESEPSQLQLSVHYSNVTEAGKTLFKSVLKKDATDFLSQQNKILSSLDTKKNPDVEGDGDYRVGVGIYYIESNSENQNDARDDVTTEIDNEKK